MGREVKRVPLDFDWPLREVWAGYELPEAYRSRTCPDCGGSGYSLTGDLWSRKWHGDEGAFDPAETGSRPWQPDDPAVIANIRVKMAREGAVFGGRRDIDESRLRFYGTADPGEQKRLEAIRMCDIWNHRWCYHLAEEDVSALRDAGKMDEWFHDGVRPLTAAEVNERLVGGWFGGPSWPGAAVHICITDRCRRAGEAVDCPTCDGEGEVWNSRAHKALHDEWQPTAPPTGDGWQLWETVTYGSPVTPVYATAEALVAALVAEGYEEAAATAFVHRGWAPSMVVTGHGEVMDGIAASAYLAEGNDGQ